MYLRTINLLHVEDDQIQRRMVAHHLNCIKDVAFTITAVDSEEDAVLAFRGGRFEFVLLDYHLSAGNGLNCLRRLRELDPIVPIVALSGTATSEVAAGLLQAGADDFLNKLDLNSEKLSCSVRDALARVDAYRGRSAGESDTQEDRVHTLLRHLFKNVVAGLGTEFTALLDEFQAAAQQAQVTPRRLEILFQTMCSELYSGGPTGSAAIHKLLRPFLLELLLRLFGGVNQTRTP